MCNSNMQVKHLPTQTLNDDMETNICRTIFKSFFLELKCLFHRLNWKSKSSALLFSYRNRSYRFGSHKHLIVEAGLAFVFLCDESIDEKQFFWERGRIFRFVNKNPLFRALWKPELKQVDESNFFGTGVLFLEQWVEACTNLLPFPCSFMLPMRTSWMPLLFLSLSVNCF